MDLIPESLELFFAIKEVNPKRPMQEISMAMTEKTVINFPNLISE